jgi:hypothetical protein
LFSSSTDPNVKVWDAATLAPLRTMQHHTDQGTRFPGTLRRS